MVTSSCFGKSCRHSKVEDQPSIIAALKHDAQTPTPTNAEQTSPSSTNHLRIWFIRKWTQKNPHSIPTATAPTTTTTIINAFIYWMRSKAIELAMTMRYVLSLSLSVSILCELWSPKSDWSCAQKVKLIFGPWTGQESMRMEWSGMDVVFEEMRWNGKGRV